MSLTKGATMAKKPLTLVRTDDKGNLVPMTLVEWARRFNEEHRLHRPS